jgi:hypothetical protein
VVRTFPRQVQFKFGADDLITEERWFVDTEQWKAAF